MHQTDNASEPARPEDAAHQPARLTRVGERATLLVELAGRTLLFDPVFGAGVKLLSGRGAGSERGEAFSRSADVVLLTARDRLRFDRRSLRGLTREATVVAPPGTGPWFCRQGFARIVELRPWESARLPGLTVTSVPAASPRSWRRLWRRPAGSGWLIEADGLRLYHAGPGTTDNVAGEVAGRWPDLSATLLPVGGRTIFTLSPGLAWDAAASIAHRLNARLSLAIPLDGGPDCSSSRETDRKPDGTLPTHRSEGGLAVLRPGEPVDLRASIFPFPGRDRTYCPRRRSRT